MTDYEIRGIAHSVNSDWWYDDHDLLQFSRALLARAAPQPAEQEPVAYMLPRDGDDCAIFREPSSFSALYSPKGWIPLYTSPPPRKPLTDEEIEEINVSLTGTRDLARMFARAIEAAHGIGGQS